MATDEEKHRDEIITLLKVGYYCLISISIDTKLKLKLYRQIGIGVFQQFSLRAEINNIKCMNQPMLACGDQMKKGIRIRDETRTD